jgi:hypothetical protein
MAGRSRKRHQKRHLEFCYRVLRDQEDGGSNPLAPTNFLTVRDLWNAGPPGGALGDRSSIRGQFTKKKERDRAMLSKRACLVSRRFARLLVRRLDISKIFISVEATFMLWSRRF